MGGAGPRQTSRQIEKGKQIKNKVIKIITSSNQEMHDGGLPPKGRSHVHIDLVADRVLYYGAAVGRAAGLAHLAQGGETLVAQGAEPSHPPPPAALPPITAPLLSNIGRSEPGTVAGVDLPWLSFQLGLVRVDMARKVEDKASIPHTQGLNLLGDLQPQYVPCPVGAVVSPDPEASLLEDPGRSLSPLFRVPFQK